MKIPQDLKMSLAVMAMGQISSNYPRLWAVSHSHTPLKPHGFFQQILVFSGFHSLSSAQAIIHQTHSQIDYNTEKTISDISFIAS